MSKEDRSDHLMSVENHTNAFLKSLKVNNSDPKNKKAKKRAAAQCLSCVKGNTCIVLRLRNTVEPYL